jgi:hypothetical protein
MAGVALRDYRPEQALFDIRYIPLSRAACRLSLILSMSSFDLRSAAASI